MSDDLLAVDVKEVTRVYPGQVNALAGIDLDRGLRGDGGHHRSFGLWQVDAPAPSGRHRLAHLGFGDGGGT